MPTILISEKNPEQLFAKTAQALLQHLAPIAADREVILGLCGGRSVVGLVKALKTLASEGSTEYRDVFRRAQFFMIDERLVPLDHADSNYGMLEKNLFQELVASSVVTQEQLHPFTPDPKHTDYGTAEYSEQLTRYGGRFDAVVLGVGEDGHVAGLFPRHATLQRHEPVFLSFFDSPKPPAGRMTATLPLLQEAGAAVLLFTGEAKREAWGRFNDPATPAHECPSIFLKENERLIIATDLA